MLDWVRAWAVQRVTSDIGKSPYKDTGSRPLMYYLVRWKLKAENPSWTICKPRACSAVAKQSQPIVGTIRVLIGFVVLARLISNPQHLYDSNADRFLAKPPFWWRRHRELSDPVKLHQGSLQSTVKRTGWTQGTDFHRMLASDLLEGSHTNGTA